MFVICYRRYCITVIAIFVICCYIVDPVVARLSGAITRLVSIVRVTRREILSRVRREDEHRYRRYRFCTCPQREESRRSSTSTSKGFARVSASISLA